MKKILLAFIFFTTLNAFSQSWAPIKTTDTLRHYVADRDLNAFRDIQTIQSILTDTTFVDSNSNTVKYFRRGFLAKNIFEQWCSCKKKYFRFQEYVIFIKYLEDTG